MSIPDGRLHQRPAGDPAQLRADARRLGAMGEQLRQVMRPYPVAMRTAVMHMPIRRLPHFSWLGGNAARRRRRLLDSLATMSGALLDYARVLERAQDAVDAANRHPVDGSPPSTGGLGNPSSRNDGVVHEPFDTTTRRMQPAGHVDDDMARLPVGLTRRLIDPGRSAGNGADADAEAALSDLRRARQRCLRAMSEIERDWPYALRTGPVRLPIIQPILLPVRHTGPVGRPPVMPIGRVRIGEPVERAPLMSVDRRPGAGSVDVVDGRVRACHTSAGVIPTNRLAQAVPA